MDDTYHLSKCLDLIQEQLSWGKAGSWTNKDFELLSEKIYDKAGMLISYQTLRRLFGKVTTSSQYKPQLETKNALAIFVGYKDWDTFKQSHPSPKLPVSDSTAPELKQESLYAAPAKTVKKPVTRTVMWAVILVLAVISTAGYYLLQNKPTGPVSFNVQNVSGKVPLNVIFHYDVSKVNADSIFLNFGNGIEKMLLPKNQKTVTMSYLVPGLYRAELKADDKIIGAKIIHAQSIGWSGIVYDNNDYYFLQDKSIIKDGVMAYLPEDKGVAQSNLYQPIKKNAVVEFNNFKDFGIDGKSFVFETRLRVIVPDSGQYCYKAFIKVKGEHYPVRAAFVSSGCNSDALLQFGEVVLEGKFHDLTFMGQPFTQWQTVRLEVNKKQGKLYLNNKLLNSTAFKNNIGAIKGLSFRLRQFGAIDYVKLYDGNNNLVYQEEFTDTLSTAKINNHLLKN